MYKHKVLVAVVAVAAVVVGSTAVSATGNHHGNNDCYEHNNAQASVLEWDQEGKSPKKNYQEHDGKDHKPRGHKKPHHKECEEEPEVCEYNPQLPKYSDDCVEPEEPETPTVPEVPETPETPEQPEEPATPTVTETKEVQQPLTFAPFVGK